MIIFCLRCPVFDRLGKTIGKTITGLFREKKEVVGSLWRLYNVGFLHDIGYGLSDSGNI